jgi:integrase
MRQKLTPTFIGKATAASGAERTTFWDAALPGFGLMVTASGHRSYVVQYRAGRTSRRLTLKNGLSLSEAKREAKAVLGAVAKNRDPLQEARAARAAELNSLRFVAEEYFAREGRNLRGRTLRGKRDSFRLYIYPRFGSRPIDSIKRSEIVHLLDKVEDENGATAAQHVLVALRRMMNWYAGRSDDFRSPIVPGMSRIKPKERARQRVLSDDELRAVWCAARTFGPYGRMLQFILLTASRLREAAGMTRDELAADSSEWLIPTARYKGKHDHLVPLSSTAQEALSAIPIIGSKGWVFTTNGIVPISGFSKFKRQFDAKALEELHKHDLQSVLPRWTTHDLRRTARSLMSRAGVNADHAERCLGHVIAGVRGTYDRHEFKDEKRRAFELLASEVKRIINPPELSVVPLRRGRP